jgi:hypothetical protein
MTPPEPAAQEANSVAMSIPRSVGVVAGLGTHAAPER